MQNSLRELGNGETNSFKRGMSATIEEWLMAAIYCLQRQSAVLLERGIRTFESSTLTLDLSCAGGETFVSLPVIVDPSRERAAVQYSMSGQPLLRC